MKIDATTETPRDDRMSGPRRAWIMLGVGLLAGFIGLQVMVVQPAKRRLATMQRELVAVRSDLDRIVGERDGIGQTNTLLSQLNEQAAYLTESREALATIREFQQDVQAEAARVAKTRDSLKSLASLQQSLLAMQETTRAADAELDRIATVQNNLVALSKPSEAVEATLTRLIRLQETLLAQVDRQTSAEYVLRQMIGVQEQLVGHSETAAVAAESLAAMTDVQATVLIESADAAAALKAASDLIAVKETVVSQADTLAAARKSATQLATLRDELVKHAAPEQTAEAFKTVESLTGLRDQLDLDKAQLETARRNLDVLIALGADLAQQTDTVVTAVQSLELLTDLRGDITAHIQSMEGFRRELIEIAMMESAISRAVQIIEPLTRLGDLRRLSQEEVRMAARVIVEKREAAAPGVPKPTQVAVQPVPAPR